MLWKTRNCRLNCVWSFKVQHFVKKPRCVKVHYQRSVKALWLGYFRPLFRTLEPQCSRSGSRSLRNRTARRFLLRCLQTLSLQPVWDPRSRATAPRPGTNERGTRCVTDKILHNHFHENPMWNLPDMMAEMKRDSLEKTCGTPLHNVLFCLSKMAKNENCSKVSKISTQMSYSRVRAYTNIVL